MYFWLRSIFHLIFSHAKGKNAFFKGYAELIRHLIGESPFGGKNIKFKGEVNKNRQKVTNNLHFIK
jgi:hypothetical protein